MSGNKRDLDLPLLGSKRQKQSSSASAASCIDNIQWRYDAFLSYRGEDTGDTFTGHLFSALDDKGIFAFNDKKMERGKEISPELLQAIEESRFSIVILSKNYASSTWCLDELAQIVECKNTKNRTVIPVFFHVDPSDVRKLNGDFETHLVNHEEKSSKQEVQRWRAALKEVANIAGFHHLQERSPETNLIKRIVKEISTSLNQTFLSITKDLVGIEPRAVKIYKCLQRNKERTLFIGICGMGGIGKTTLARVVYRRLSYQYEGSCFLANVKEVCEKKGVAHLQEILLSKVLKERNLTICDAYEGIDLIRRRLCRKKVFIVLDDVDDQLEQLEKLAGKEDWFGFGSKIIITTRNERVLISHGINNRYKVEELDRGDASRLIHMKAFKHKQPTDDHDKLLARVMDYANGLPLALEVLGSFLCDRNVNEWRSALDSLQDYPDKKILNTLRISFDGLKQNEKDIFLHIACFFKGNDRDRVMKKLRSWDLYPDVGIENLIEKSLVTISTDRDRVMKKRRSWDLYTDVGSEYLIEQSLVTISNDRDRVMKKQRSWDLNTDDGIENIFEKFLVKISNERNRVMKKLMSFGIPKSNDTLEMHDLIQEMAFEIIREHNHREPGKWSRLWRVKEVSYVLTENKGTEAIEAIILNMPEQGLDSIMQGMPEQGISGKSFTTMKNLRLLKISNVRFSDDHLEYLSNELWLLKWRGYPLKTFPSSFQPKNLFKLDMCYSHVEFLWGDKKHLEKLKTIKLSYSCNLIETPDFTNIPNLEKLELENCTKLRRIHPSIGSLKRLRILRLNNCNLSEGIIPNDLGSLISLEELYLSGNNFVSLPESISELPKLKHLCLNECHRLRWLPKLPPDIYFLLAEDCTSLETISSAKKQSTSSRSMLYFINCCKLTENQGMKDNLAVTLLKQRLQDLSHHSYRFDICLPGTEIPKWFSHCNNFGSSIGIGLRDNWLNDDFMGFAVCTVFDHNWGHGRRIECSLRSQANIPDFRFHMRTFTTAMSDHLWLGYLSREILKELPVDKCVHAHFNIDLQMCLPYLVKRCALRLVYKQDLEYFESSAVRGGSMFEQNHKFCAYRVRKMVFDGDNFLDDWWSKKWPICQMYLNP